MAVVLITHDLGVVADVADRVMVMYAGRAVEEATSTTCSPRRSTRTRRACWRRSAVPADGPASHLVEIPGVVPTLLAPRDLVLVRATLPAGRRSNALGAAAPPGGRARAFRGLLLPGSRPMIARSHRPASAARPTRDVVLDVVDLEMQFRVGGRASAERRLLRAVDKVSLRIHRGETVALVGESGSGKTTIGRCVVRLIRPTAGRIVVLGRDITRIGRRELRPLRRQMHVVFQDPYSSLNPRMTVGQIVGGPLHPPRAGERAGDGASAGRGDAGTRRPAAGAPGSLPPQPVRRAAPARRDRPGAHHPPGLLVADEPISALDASVQAATLNLLVDLQREMQFACLFITHDLSRRRVPGRPDRGDVPGEIVEEGSREEIFRRPRHPYTQALLSAVLIADPAVQRTRAQILLPGDPPSPLDPPPGCRFHTALPDRHRPLQGRGAAPRRPGRRVAPGELPPRRTERRGATHRRGRCGRGRVTTASNAIGLLRGGGFADSGAVIDPGHLLAAAGLAVFAGTFGALVGVGGGVVVVPALTILLGVPIKTAAAASLLGVIVTSLVAGSRYLEAGTVDRRLGLVLLAATSSGAVLGGFVANAVDATILSALFGLVLLFVAIQVGWSRERPSSHVVASGGFASSYVEPTTGATVEYRAERVGFGLALSVVAGGLSGLLGIGGGTVNVPTMSTIMGVPFRVAVTTSTYMLGATAAAELRRVLRPRPARPVHRRPGRPGDHRRGADRIAGRAPGQHDRAAAGVRRAVHPACAPDAG